MICPGCHIQNPDTNRYCQRCFRLLQVGGATGPAFLNFKPPAKAPRWQFWRLI
jgi:hypothetical protein